MHITVDVVTSNTITMAIIFIISRGLITSIPQGPKNSLIRHCVYFLAEHAPISLCRFTRRFSEWSSEEHVRRGIRNPTQRYFSCE